MDNAPITAMQIYGNMKQENITVNILSITSKAHWWINLCYNFGFKLERSAGPPLFRL